VTNGASGIDRMYVEIKHTNPWTDYTLIMPMVSVGNIGQLAVDLLISTMQPRKVGYFYDAAFWPIVGSDPYCTPGSGRGDIVTSCEVYESTERKVVLVQQRVPIIRYRRYDFRRKMMAWIRKNKFGKVVILSSCSTHSRRDDQLEGFMVWILQRTLVHLVDKYLHGRDLLDQLLLSKSYSSSLRYICTPAVDQSIVNHLSKKLNWTQLERRISLPTPSSVQTEFNGAEPTEIYIPGGGYTKKMFQECTKDDIPLVVLMMFCSEGDNIQDALAMAAYLNEWLKIVQLANIREGNDALRWKAWKVPPSWTLLFGKRAPVTIYW